MGSPEEFFVKGGITKDHLLKWVLDFGERKKKIEAFPRVRECLAQLSDAGADPETLLGGIVLMYPGAIVSTKRQLKVLNRRLSNLADRLEGIYRDVESTVSDPLCHSAFYRAILIENQDFRDTENRIRDAKYLCKSFEIFVNFFRAEAQALQKLIREYESERTNSGLGPVLNYVKHTTGSFHDDLMAELLQSAHDALGVKAVFSAEKLRKLRQRKLPGMVRKRKAHSGLDQLYGMFID